MGFVVELFVSWCDFLQQDQPYHLPSVIFLVSLNNRLKPVPPSTREILSFEYCPIWLSVLSMRAILLFEYFQYDCPLCPSRKQFFCCLTVHPIRCSSILQKEDFFCYLNVRPVRLCVLSFNRSIALLFEYLTNSIACSIFQREESCCYCPIPSFFLSFNRSNLIVSSIEL